MARQQLCRLLGKVVVASCNPIHMQRSLAVPAGMLGSGWAPPTSSRTFSSSAALGTNTGNEDSPSSSGGPPDDQFSRMMEVMMENPTVMQMMMARMPPHMRRPEVMKALMANPDVRARLSAVAQEKGLASIIQSVDLDQVKAGMSATLQAGIDPAAIVARFQESPALAKAMQNPRVMAALMDMASNGAGALKKYQGDKDIIEAAMETGQILQQLQQQGGAQASSSSSSSSDGSLSPSSSDSPSSSMADVEQQLGVSPEQLMQRLISRPDLLAKVQDPEVQNALLDVSQSPWKIVKYMFNKKVMSALKDMKEVVDEGKR